MDLEKSIIELFIVLVGFMFHQFFYDYIKKHLIFYIFQIEEFAIVKLYKDQLMQKYNEKCCDTWH